MSWRRSGFSIDNSVRIPSGEPRALEQVARYMLRAPVSLCRIRWRQGDKELFYVTKGSHDDPEDPSLEGQRIDAQEFIARVIAPIAQPKIHLIFYYGRYSNALRGRRLKGQPESQPPEDNDTQPAGEPTLSPARKAALRRRWADLIRRVFEVDPLVCDRCRGELRVIAFITEPRIIRRILDHLKKRDGRNRAPPQSPTSISV